MEVSKKYKIIGPLGEHRKRKFGTLILAQNRMSGEQCVMKVIMKSDQSKVAEDRLRAESSFHFKLPGLPKILDVYEDEEQLILVRNFVEANTLAQRFKEVKRRERHVFICGILKQLGTLLDHLHSKAIYHCDIKPGNVLIDSSNKVHLIDFGLAIQQPEISNRKLLFPLGYAAPELLLNHLDLVDHRTDYFALGITLWRLYAGKLPLTHPNPSIFTNLQLTHPLPENDAVTRKTQKVLEKMCAKYAFQLPPNKMDAEKVKSHLLAGLQYRYATYSEFLQDFISAGNRGVFTKKYLDDTQY